MTFAELAEYFQKLEGTSSRNIMTEILSELFGKVNKNEITKICYLLQGRVAPLYEAVEFGVADKFMIRAIARAYGVNEEGIKNEFKKVGDLGITAETCYKGGKSTRLSVGEVFAKLLSIALAAGNGSQEKKISLLSALLGQVDRLSSRYLVRIPLDKLRLGFSEMTILDGLSWMISGNKLQRPQLEAAYNVRPDIGYLAQTVKSEGIEGVAKVKAKLNVPILVTLCQRLTGAAEMIKKMGKVAVEPKYDGVRTQIHYQEPTKVKTFSRNLENTTEMFPELQEVGQQLKAQEVILDSEAVGFNPKTGKLIPFQETMTRKRKHEIEKMRSSVPLRFFVFDILYRDGQDLLQKSLGERRRILEETVKPGNVLMVSPQIVTESANNLRGYHDDQLQKGFEGVVVKKWDSPYEAGRRGYSWVKFKEEEGKAGKLTDTIDAVVMGYTKGQGKRTAFGIGQVLLGVREGEDFVSLTKLGSGATEKELLELFGILKKLSVKVKPKQYKNVNKIYTPDVWVNPKMVLEIAGDDLTKSPAHSAGFAVRFPRLVRIRTDKSPQEVTTLAEIKRMFKCKLSFGN